MTNNATTTFVTNANDIRDIAAPVVIPSGWAWLGWVLLTAALALGLFLLWRWWQKRQNLKLLVPPLPPHVRAKQRLQAALNLIDQPRPYCFAVSDALREYLEERFQFHAPERTTEEFLHELQHTELLSAGQKAQLGDFLQRCDLVKFAKYEPTKPELHELYASARRLVEETEPGQATSPESPASSDADNSHLTSPSHHTPSSTARSDIVDRKA